MFPDGVPHEAMGPITETELMTAKIWSAADINFLWNSGISAIPGDRMGVPNN